jgi:hypothetical protein
VWQVHRERWFPKGLEIVAVALDVDPEEAKPFMRSDPPLEYPAVIDCAHVCDELFGFVNVPNAVWIDEQGTIVRPAEPAHPGSNPFTESFRSIDIDRLPDDIADVLREARKIKSDPEQYVAMIEDWVARGADSSYALAPGEVIRRSGSRDDSLARAAAEFELGQFLHRAGNHDAAIPHWRNAHRLHPDNWTYKRQAWNFEDPMRQGKTDAYDGSWYDDIKQLGAENYYPPIVP